MALLLCIMTVEFNIKWVPVYLIFIEHYCDTETGIEHKNGSRSQRVTVTLKPELNIKMGLGL
jgi:hypothetical protein